MKNYVEKFLFLKYLEKLDILMDSKPFDDIIIRDYSDCEWYQFDKSAGKCKFFVGKYRDISNP